MVLVVGRCARRTLRGGVVMVLVVGRCARRTLRGGVILPGNAKRRKTLALNNWLPEPVGCAVRTGEKPRNNLVSGLLECTRHTGAGLILFTDQALHA